MGQQPQLGQPQPTLNPDEQFAESIYNVSIFGDERDIVIAKWNYLQAMWGSGKAFYAKNLPPVEITPQNVNQMHITLFAFKIKNQRQKNNFIIHTFYLKIF